MLLSEKALYLSWENKSFLLNYFYIKRHYIFMCELRVMQEKLHRFEKFKLKQKKNERKILIEIRKILIDQEKNL